MASKTGIVMEIKNKKACIMTSSGEFAEVKISGTVPEIGSIYTGLAVSKVPFYKYVAAAACLIFFISTGGIAYAYYTPTASVTLDKALELKVNRWDKIIETKSLNEEGEKLLKSSKIKNKNINDGLNIIMEESKKNNVKVSMDVTVDGDKTLDLPNFKSLSEKKDTDLEVNNSNDTSKNANKPAIINDSNRNISAPKLNRWENNASKSKSKDNSSNINVKTNEKQNGKMNNKRRSLNGQKNFKDKQNKKDKINKKDTKENKNSKDRSNSKIKNKNNNSQ